MCFKGFVVNLHCSFGVGSPNLYETYACEYSCNQIAITKMTAKVTISKILANIHISYIKPNNFQDLL